MDKKEQISNEMNEGSIYVALTGNANSFYFFENLIIS